MSGTDEFGLPRAASGRFKPGGGGGGGGAGRLERAASGHGWDGADVPPQPPVAPVPSVPEPTPAPQPKPAAIPDHQQMAHAIQMATAAVAADNGKDYAKAFELYRSSLGHFMKGLQLEADKAKKALIMQRMEGYMKRAEQLKACSFAAAEMS